MNPMFASPPVSPSLESALQPPNHTKFVIEFCPNYDFLKSQVCIIYSPLHYIYKCLYRTLQFYMRYWRAHSVLLFCFIFKQKLRFLYTKTFINEIKTWSVYYFVIFLCILNNLILCNVFIFLATYSIFLPTYSENLFRIENGKNCNNFQLV